MKTNDLEKNKTIKYINYHDGWLPKAADKKIDNGCPISNERDRISPFKKIIYLDFNWLDEMNIYRFHSKIFFVRFVVFQYFILKISCESTLKWNKSVRPDDASLCQRADRPVEVSACWNAARWSVGCLRCRSVAIRPKFSGGIATDRHFNGPTLQRAAFQRADTSTGRNACQPAESARWNRLDSTGRPAVSSGRTLSTLLNALVILKLNYNINVNF